MNYEQPITWFWVLLMLADMRSALVILDRGTRWLQCYPLPDKSSDAAIKAFTSFLGPRESAQLFYSDNSQELINAGGITYGVAS